jgi:Mce-associated membrane protein
MANDAGTPDGELTESSGTEPESLATEDSTGSTTDTVDDTADAGDSADAGDAAEGDAAEADAVDVVDAAEPRPSHVKVAMIAGLVLVLALSGLTGWLGFRAYQSYTAEQDRNLFLQVGRQGALNLTTIDHQRAEEDVQRVLDSATGTFYDDFQSRAQPFIEVVKQAQSKSVGNVTEAGLESVSGDEARVLVAVTVNTSNAGAPEQEPRAWRMRLTVKKVEDEAKVSNVEFVP